jgi:hypothetical protein
MTRSAPLLLLAWLGCKKEDPPPTYPSPLAFPAPAPAPSPTIPPSPSAAPGFFCATDADLQCPFGRCSNGRCGGCSSAADCKPGAVCASTWVGMACLPGSGAQSAPPATTTSPAAPPPVVAAPAPIPVPASSTTADPFSSARARCVDRTNAYRARVGASPVQRRTDFETCADAAAQSDARARSVHGAFGRCHEFAQNECPAWSGAPDTVVDQCLDMMFAEGPGGGHYVNMTNGGYRGLSCGIFTGAGGEVWIVQNYYR